MKICIVAEGCYPYVVGGVSSWIHSLIHAFPQHEFIILSIISARYMRGNFVYEMPENVTEVYEVYLNDEEWAGRRYSRKRRLKKGQYQALRSLVINQGVNWDALFDLFQDHRLSLDNLLMGPDFYEIVRDYYDLQYAQVSFTDFLWTMRSIYLPLFLALNMKIPKADLYHCASTGYAGVLGSMGKYLHGGRLLISEHGIYTREREEELIRASWVQGIFKNIWTEQFRKMSKVAYDRADLVVSLYNNARELQIELGCPANKTIVVPNGVKVEDFADIPGKSEEEKKMIHIGAVLRIAPIKDVKTLLQAFSYAKERESRLKLWVMGPWEEEDDYARECFELVEAMDIKDVVFTGKVNVKEYMGKMDFMILTSISEGQPLVILESFAAGKPVIATDVGNCKGLIYGEEDEFGPAGIITHIMNTEEITDAILRLSWDKGLRTVMGRRGYDRVNANYRTNRMWGAYWNFYHDFALSCGLKDEEENPFEEKEKNSRRQTGGMTDGRNRC